jgi:hypothetical protein
MVNEERFLGMRVAMPRTARQWPEGIIFHIHNYGNSRDRIFDDDAVE